MTLLQLLNQEDRMTRYDLDANCRTSSTTTGPSTAAATTTTVDMITSNYRLQQRPLRMLRTPSASTHHNNYHQHHHHHSSGQDECLLLDKLQGMVPIMPRGRTLSELEVINHVIEYIKQLREMVDETTTPQPPVASYD